MKPFFYILNHSKIVDYVGWYQEKCRCYLDEYPEQEKLREEWFNKIVWIDKNYTGYTYKALIEACKNYSQLGCEWSHLIHTRWLRRN